MFDLKSISFSSFDEENHKDCSSENTDIEYTVSGAISGAITDVNSKRAKEQAVLAYETIRNSKTDVKNISQNTGYSEEDIRRVKNYLFVDEHEIYEDGEFIVNRFYPDFCIAQSWLRLAFHPDKIVDHDYTLLKHEIKEMELIKQGYSQNEAHIITEKRYFNYASECKKYYGELKRNEVEKQW